MPSRLAVPLHKSASLVRTPNSASRNSTGGVFSFVKMVLMRSNISELRLKDNRRLALQPILFHLCELAPDGAGCPPIFGSRPRAAGLPAPARGALGDAPNRPSGAKSSCRRAKTGVLVQKRRFSAKSGSPQMKWGARKTKWGDGKTIFRRRKTKWGAPQTVSRHRKTIRGDWKTVWGARKSIWGDGKMVWGRRKMKWGAPQTVLRHREMKWGAPQMIFRHRKTVWGGRKTVFR